jgi:hypothetical protein
MLQPHSLKTRLWFAHILDEFTPALSKQIPSLPIAFIAIASLLVRPRDWTKHDRAFPSFAEYQHSRNQIPDFLRYDVGGKQIDMPQRVIAVAHRVGNNLASVPRVNSVAGGFHLHAQKILSVLNADVVRSRVSPGLADGEAALGCLRHEFQLDPFAAFFETGKSLPVLHLFPSKSACKSPCPGIVCGKPPLLPKPVRSGAPSIVWNWNSLGEGRATEQQKGATGRPRLQN